MRSRRRQRPNIVAGRYSALSGVGVAAPRPGARASARAPAGGPRTLHHPRQLAVRLECFAAVIALALAGGGHDGLDPLGAFAVIGAVLGLVIGYAVDGGIANFLFWAAWDPSETAVLAIAGLIVGAAVGYLRRRNAK